MLSDTMELEALKVNQVEYWGVNLEVLVEVGDVISDASMTG